MTKIALQAMKRVLEERRAELENRNRSRGALTIERSSDELDQIQDGQEREFAIGELDRNSARLREVREALVRIEIRKFGVCVDCEDDINPKRLAAVPWASLCIACQEAADSAEKTAWGEIDSALDMAA
jgi:RNA polymerase-binding transcription factor